MTASPTLPWASRKVYNPALVYHGGKFCMLFRAMGSDGISRIGYAESIDGITFVIAHDPVIIPENSWEKCGCEDPRVTKVNNLFYLCYTGFDGANARLCLAVSSDLKKWEKFGPIFADGVEGIWTKWSHPHKAWSKAGTIFPEKIGETYSMFFGDEYIWHAESTDLIHWRASTDPVVTPRKKFFDAGYVEMGSPPLKTPKGWLVLYHGINKKQFVPGNHLAYGLGALLLDLHDPLTILWRSEKPILEPVEVYERIGYIDIITQDGNFSELLALSQDDLLAKSKREDLPTAVICCGALLRNDILFVYYAAMDTSICLATVKLQDILN